MSSDVAGCGVRSRLWTKRGADLRAGANPMPAPFIKPPDCGVTTRFSSTVALFVGGSCEIRFEGVKV